MPDALPMSNPHAPPVPTSALDGVRTRKRREWWRMAFAFAALSLFVGIVYPFDRSDVYLMQDSISGPLWWSASPDSAVRFSASFSAIVLLAGMASAMVQPRFLTIGIAAAAIFIWLAVGYLHVALLSP